jgi:hypothetical protein
MKGVDEEGHFNKQYYFVGIIDILMLYTLRKRGEHAYKLLRFGGVRSKIVQFAYLFIGNFFCAPYRIFASLPKFCWKHY